MDLDTELFVDRFCAMRKPAPVRQKPAPAPESQPATDTDRLRAEVAEFMQRGSEETAEDSEVQEFLKERSGFDPGEIE
jgi:hypothetical protein